ncbi:hypothetical protein B0H13DRAFT_1910951 [Mycena leptocephala]|nr:hypothetical protein B0H13DRAFT_1910951 [Mycena leptocephala]
MDAGRGFSEFGTPLISPLTPLPADVLDRTCKGTFGPEDPHLQEGTVFRRVQAATDGSVVSPQTLYTGKDVRGNGQEVYHAIMLNARLLVHNPDTGEPGAINGHAGVQFYAAPNSERVWNMEVPYVPDAQIGATLVKYGKGVHREADPDSGNESPVSDGWCPTPPIVAPVPRRAATAPVLAYASPEPEETDETSKLAVSCTEDTEQRIAAEAALFSLDDGTLGNVKAPVGSRIARPPWALQYNAPADIAEPDDPIKPWSPVSDAWTAANPMPLERWDVSSGHVERVQYHPRLCNWQRSADENRLPKLVFSNFTNEGADAPYPEILLSAIDKEPSDNSSSSSEEEGEITDHAPPHGNTPSSSQLRSRVDELRVPALGSLRHGALITRSDYSSSPSAAPSESTADIPAYDQAYDTTDAAVTADRLAEAEKIINEVVHRVARGTVDPEPLFHFESDSDSMPELVTGSSSESSGASGLDRLSLEGTTEVLTVDCVDALCRIRGAAPSPEYDLHGRSAVQTRLLSWGRQQEALLERLRDDENRHAILPLQQGLDIINQDLDSLIDRTANTVEVGGIISNESKTLDAERTLDLVTQRISTGKRKVRDETSIAISGDGKRMRCLGGSAWACTPTSRAALQAEAARLRAFLIPLIEVRGNLLDFLSRILVLVTQRRYNLDMTTIGQYSDVTFPLLKQDEFLQLNIVRKAFNDRGQTAVVDAIDAILGLHFQEAHVLVHLLHYEILSLEEPYAADDHLDAKSTAKNFERACFDQRYPMPVSNQFLRQMTPLVPAWLANTSQGPDARAATPVSGGFRRDQSPKPVMPHYVYNEAGYYVPRPTVRSPIPVQFKPRVNGEEIMTTDGMDTRRIFRAVAGLICGALVTIYVA